MFICIKLSFFLTKRCNAKVNKGVSVGSMPLEVEVGEEVAEEETEEA